MGNLLMEVGNLLLKGCVGDSRLGTGLTTANCIANRFGVNNNSTGATLQRRDRPPISIRNISFSFKVGNQQMGNLSLERLRRR
jgi:hypothetical protein